MRKLKDKKQKNKFTKFQKIFLMTVAAVLIIGLGLFFARHKIFAQTGDSGDVTTPEGALPIPDFTAPQNLQSQIKYMDEDTLRNLQQPQ